MCEGLSEGLLSYSEGVKVSGGLLGRDFVKKIGGDQSRVCTGTSLLRHTTDQERLLSSCWLCSVGE